MSKLLLLVNRVKGTILTLECSINFYLFRKKNIWGNDFKVLDNKQWRSVMLEKREINKLSSTITLLYYLESFQAMVQEEMEAKPCGYPTIRRRIRRCKRTSSGGSVDRQMVRRNLHRKRMSFRNMPRVPSYTSLAECWSCKSKTTSPGKEQTEESWSYTKSLRVDVLRSQDVKT